MANIKSAKKRVLIAERNRLRNQAFKSAIRTAIRRIHEAIEAKTKAPELQERLNKAYSLMDKAVLKGILHKNTVARYKSAIAKVVSSKTSVA